MPDQNKIDLIIKYSLLVSGQEDTLPEQRLGAIHFIKYVYLADLEYAGRHEGKTFTGVDWTFYKFGPWSQDVNARIEPSMLAIGATRLSFPSSKFGREDCVRWTAHASEAVLNDIKKQLPMEIRATIGNLVHKFKNDTGSLLNYVYASVPMLKAAPKEHLDFNLVAKRTVQQEEVFVPMLERISDTDRKKLVEDMKQLKDRFKKKMDSDRRSQDIPFKPRYDDVFFQGMKWLDEIAGPQFTEKEFEAEFSNSIWKSPARSGNE